MSLGVSGGVSRTRCAAAWAVVTGTATTLAVGLAPAMVDLPSARFDEVLVWLSADVAAAVTAWLWLVATAVIVDAARGVSRARRGVPAGVRSGVLLICGVALTAGLATPAWAGPGGTGPAVLDGLRLPERVGIPPAPPPAPDALPAVPTAGHRVLVRPGDTLWGIAAEHLGDAASVSDVAAYWPQVYAANRDRIGPDPGLIAPGQLLVLPERGGHVDR